jgi:hypothetical protein
MTGSSGSVTVPIRLTAKDPNVVGGVTTSDTNIVVSWQSVKDMRTSSIVLTGWDPFGKYELDIEAHATETFNLAGASAVGSAIRFLDSSKVQWAAQYYADQAACSRAFLDVADRYVRGHRYLNLVLTLPDPPEQYDAALRTLRNLGRELESRQHAPAEVQRGIDQFLRAGWACQQARCETWRAIKGTTGRACSRQRSCRTNARAMSRGRNIGVEVEVLQHRSLHAVEATGSAEPRECSISSFPRKREVKASPAFAATPRAR